LSVGSDAAARVWKAAGKWDGDGEEWGRQLHGMERAKRSREVDAQRRFGRPVTMRHRAFFFEDP